MEEVPNNPPNRKQVRKPSFSFEGPPGARQDPSEYFGESQSRTTFESDRAQSGVSVPHFSPSVRAASTEFSEPIAAIQLVIRLLRLHPEYGSRGGEAAIGRAMAASIDTAARRSASDWLGNVASFFRKGYFITGRCVLAGLALLDEAVRQALIAGKFLEALANEPYSSSRTETVLDVLEPEPSARLAALFQPRLDGLMQGSTETWSDVPAKDDLLGRRVFAEVLARRIVRLREGEQTSPLVVHLDGPWGSGKSTVLGFLQKVLEGAKGDRLGPWLVLPYNAWQQQHLDAPWWTLATLIARGGRRSTPKHVATVIQMRHFWFRTVAGRVSMLLAGLIAIAAGFWLFRSDLTAGAAAKTLQEALGAAGIIFGVVLAGSRFLAASDASAQEFLRSRPDPLGSLVLHVRALLKLIRRPVAVLVDDLDRCDASAVVRLLEGVHTVFGQASIVFVIAGDARWIGQSFEKVYAEAGSRSSTGRPLGTLFLEKLCQFSALVPDMPDELKKRYWRHLLHLPIVDQTVPADDMASARSEEDVLQLVAEVDPRKQPLRARAIREAAMLRLAMPDLINKPSLHVLETFEGLVEANPRSMKRHIMAYGMARACDLASFRNTPAAVLATWSILSLRWPALADWLREAPERLGLKESADMTDEDRLFAKLLQQHEVRLVLVGNPPKVPEFDVPTLFQVLGRSMPAFHRSSV